MNSSPYCFETTCASVPRTPIATRPKRSGFQTIQERLACLHRRQGANHSGHHGTHGPLGFRRGLATGANKRMCDDTHSHAISHRNVAVLVIGGTSHTGKSTLGHSLASDLGWRHLSNDAIARHPGRPFRGDSKVPGTLPESHYPRID